MRTRLLSLGVGLLGAAGLVGIAWGAQLVALPAPAHADRIAADAARWLDDYRMSVAVFHTGGHRVEALCVHGAPADRHGERSKSSFLVLAPGQTLHITEKHDDERVTDLAGRTNEPGLLAANAACTHELLAQIGAATRAAVAIDASPAVVAGQPAVALRLSRIRHERLTLYVAPTTYRPLAASVLIDGRRLTALLQLRRLDRTVLARFGLSSHRP